MPINRQDMTQTDRWYDPTDIAEKMKEADVIQCHCGCSHFEQVAVHQFPKMHNVILGQQVQPAGDLGFYVFRCLKCSEIYEPSVQLAARDQSRKSYENFLDEMEKPIVAGRTTPEVI